MPPSFVDEGDATRQAPPSRARALFKYHYAPAAVAVVLAVLGLLGLRELNESVDVLWRPLLAITSVMVMADAVNRLGVAERVAAGLFPIAHGSGRRLFVLVFLVSGATATVLNNDAAVLLLVPLVLGLVRRLYPGDSRVEGPFVLAIFMAGGVAPFAVSNPMNLIVAEYAGLDFNAYALRMVPIALLSSVCTLGVLLFLFRRPLAIAPELPARLPRRAWTSREAQGLAVLLIMFAAYPVVAYAGGPVHLVAVAGALAALALCAYYRVAGPWTVVRRGIAWEILVFLAGVSIVAVGLQEASVSRQLADFYNETGVFGIGLVSAAGSALLNNHPMSIVNMLALDQGSDPGLQSVLAALIGGNIGPRILPWGSLAGLLWFASLRRVNVYMPVRNFVVIGVLVTAVTLPLSLLLLIALP